MQRYIKNRTYQRIGLLFNVIKSENGKVGVQKPMQDVFLSCIRSPKTPLQVETHRPDFDTLTSADSHYWRANSKKQLQVVVK